MMYTKTCCPYCRAPLSGWSCYADTFIGPPQEQCGRCGKVYSTGRNFWCDMMKEEQRYWTARRFRTSVWTVFFYSFGVLFGSAWLLHMVWKEAEWGLLIGAAPFGVLSVVLLTCRLRAKNRLLKSLTPGNYAEKMGCS